MATSGRNERKQKPAAPPVTDQRKAGTGDTLADRAAVAGRSDVPVRTIVFMEVGGLPVEEVRRAVAIAREGHGQALHPTYVMAVRNGRPSGDILFESELLEFINKVCRVADGRIVLNGDATGVDVLRAHL